MFTIQSTISKGIQRMNNNGTEEDIEKLTKSMDKVESKFQECVDNSSNEKEFLRNVEDAIDSSGYNRIRATYSKIN